MSAPVASGGVLYGLTHRNRGQFFALDVATGRTLWTSPPRQGENAALTAAANVLIVTTTEGELVVMPMNKQGHGVVRSTRSRRARSGRTRRSRPPACW